MNKIAQFFLTGLVLVSAVVVFDGFYVLPEGKQVVITQFGAPVGRPIASAGIHFKMPFMHQVNYFEKKIQIWDGDPNQVPTNDKTFVYLDITARWRITDALTYLQTAKTEARAQSLLDDIIDGTVRDLVNKNDLIEIVRSSDWSKDTMSNISDSTITEINKGRDVIAAQVLEIAAKATPKYGIELIDVMFKRVNYIESVRLKVYDRMISERKRIAAEKRAIGEGEKAEILGKVDRELKTIISKASGEAAAIKGKGDAIATKIYGEAYGQDPEFYAFTKTLSGYKKIMSKNTSLIISPNADVFKYLDNISGKD